MQGAVFVAEPVVALSAETTAPRERRAVAAARVKDATTRATTAARVTTVARVTAKAAAAAAAAVRVAIIVTAAAMGEMGEMGVMGAVVSITAKVGAVVAEHVGCCLERDEDVAAHGQVGCAETAWC